MKGAWANIPTKSNRNDPICFSPYLYRARNRVERFFNRIKQCRRFATTRSLPLFTLLLSSLHPSGCGWLPLMSPRLDRNFSVNGSSPLAKPARMRH